MDDAILARFKGQSEKTGTGYQTLINDVLKAHLGLTERPVTQALVRKIVREELAAHGRRRVAAHRKQESPSPA